MPRLLTSNRDEQIQRDGSIRDCSRYVGVKVVLKPLHVCSIRHWHLPTSTLSLHGYHLRSRAGWQLILLSVESISPQRWYRTTSASVHPSFATFPGPYSAHGQKARLAER